MMKSWGPGPGCKLKIISLQTFNYPIYTDKQIMTISINAWRNFFSFKYSSVILTHLLCVLPLFAWCILYNRLFIFCKVSLYSFCKVSLKNHTGYVGSTVHARLSPDSTVIVILRTNLGNIFSPGASKSIVEPGLRT